jgi:hypothetical protein
VAYKLQLRDGCTVHPVFHVSLLKRAVHPTTVVSLELSDLSHELQVPYLILTDVYINGKIRCSLKCLLSGPSGQLSYLPGKMKMYYAINFQGRRLGVKPVLKGEGMLEIIWRPRHNGAQHIKIMGLTQPKRLALPSDLFFLFSLFCNFQQSSII